MSVCLEEQPFNSAKEYLEHLRECPMKGTYTGCEKSAITLIRYADLNTFRKHLHENIRELSAHYIYMVTFTLDPKKIKGDKQQHLKKVEDYIIKLINSKTLKHVNVSYMAHERGKDNDNDHWHLSMECSKSLKKDRFTTYIKRYGNVRIDKSRTGKMVHIWEYIQKDSEPICIKNNSS